MCGMGMHHTDCDGIGQDVVSLTEAGLFATSDRVAALPDTVVVLPVTVAALPVTVAALPVTVAVLPVTVAVLPVTVAVKHGFMTVQQALSDVSGGITGHSLAITPARPGFPGRAYFPLSRPSGGGPGWGFLDHAVKWRDIAHGDSA